MQRGADVNARDKRGLTALHFAAGRGWVDVVRLLWSKAADLEAEATVTGCTPLHLAALNGRTDVASFLLEKGALVAAEDAEEGTPLHAAARGGHVDVVVALVEAGAPLGAKNKAGLTPGAAAIAAGHVAVAQALAERGWRPDAPEERPARFSLAHLAAGAGRAAAAAWALQRGAGAVDDAENADGATPLHCAALEADPEACQLLLEAGADPGTADARGRLPAEWVPSDGPVELAAEVMELLGGRERARRGRAGEERARGEAAPAAGVSKRQAAFLALPPDDRRRRARRWAGMPPPELADALLGFPGAAEIRRRSGAAAELGRTLGIIRAMASLRADEEFQEDVARPEVAAAVAELRSNPGAYDRLAGDPRVASVVAKMRRVHAAVQVQGLRGFSMEELVVPRGQTPAEAAAADAERIQAGEAQVGALLAAAVAAAECADGSGAAEAAEAAFKWTAGGAAATRVAQGPADAAEDPEFSPLGMFEAAAREGEEQKREGRWRRRGAAAVVAAVLLLWLFSLLRAGLLGPGPRRAAGQHSEL